MKGLAFLGVLLLALPIVFQVLPANGALRSISEVQSGLVARDSLTTGNTAYWTFYGDAVAQNAPYKYNENSSGLYIGVKAATNTPPTTSLWNTQYLSPSATSAYDNALGLTTSVPAG